MVYLAEISITGFKSYRETQTIRLDPNYNVIVGLNGHGKTNLLKAIEFVCGSTEYEPKDAPKLLYQQKSDQVQTCRVEMILKSRPGDDTEDEFQFTEMRFGRSLNIRRKEDFTINGKTVDGGRYRGRLQSLGFTSFENPYYLVRQGRVAEIAGQSDEQRYRLIAEAALVTDYEKKLKDAKKEMLETKKKELNVESTMTDIKAKLEDLELESKEIAVYNELNDSLQYCHGRIKVTSFEKEKKTLNATEKDLATTEGKLNHAKTKTDALDDALAENKADVADVAEQIEATEKERVSQNTLLTTLEEHHTAKQAEFEKVEAVWRETCGRKEALEERKRELKQQLKELTKAHSTSHANLKTLKLQTADMEAKLGMVESEHAALEAKDKGEVPFDSNEERVEHLQNTLHTAESGLDKERQKAKELEGRIKRADAELEELNRTLASFNTANTQKENDLQGKKHAVEEEMNTVDSELVKLKAKSIELRREIQKSITDTSQNNRNPSMFYQNLGMRNQDARLYADLMEALDKKLLDRDIKEEVYGLLPELFSLKRIDGEKPYKVIDGAAEKDLFTVVVKNTDTASLLSKFCRDWNKRNRSFGALTFCPVDNIRGRNWYKRSHMNPVPDGCHALVDLMDYDPFFEPAIFQRFGRFLLCPDLDGAHHAMRSTRWPSGITLDGTVVSQDGAARGGHVREQMREAERIIHFRERTDLLKKEEAGLLASMEGLEQKRQTLNVQKNAIFEELAARRNAQRADEERRKKIQTEADHTATSRETIQDLIDVSRQSVDRFDQDIARLRRDLLDPDAFTFTKKDKERMTQLHGERTKLDKALAAKVEERDEAEAISSGGSEKLEEIKADLDQTVSDLNRMGNTVDIELEQKRQHALDATTAATDAFESKAAENEARNNNLVELKELKAKRLKLIDSDEKKKEEWAEKKETLSAKFHADCNLIEQRRSNVAAEELLVKSLIRPPSNPMEERLFVLKTSQLKAEIDRMNQEMKELGTKLNYSAHEEFLKHRRDYDHAKQQQEHLKESEHRILELIEITNKNKVEALNTTFLKVKKHFKKIFAQIVNRGKCDLTLHTPEESENASQQDKLLDTSSGYVSIKISFSGQSKSYYRMDQLSGGQRTVVAVSLIFALQAAEPAPIYVLDEIDAALDDQYRHKIGEIMSAASASSQFVMTTFRKQIAEFGRLFVYIRLVSRKSVHSEISKETALDSVMREAIMEEDENERPLAIEE